MLSPAPMSAGQAQDYDESLVGIGVVESEVLEANLASQVAQQLAHSAHALVSAESFDECAHDNDALMCLGVLEALEVGRPVPDGCDRTGMAKQGLISEVRYGGWVITSLGRLRLQNLRSISNLAHSHSGRDSR